MREKEFSFRKVQMSIRRTMLGGPYGHYILSSGPTSVYCSDSTVYDNCNSNNKKKCSDAKRSAYNMIKRQRNGMG